MTMLAAEVDAADKLERHLDICKQCEQHPFELCEIGVHLLKDFATKMALAIAAVQKGAAR